MTILDEISKARVLIVGDVMLDRYWWGDVTRISPEAPVPVVRLTGNTAAPGGAANVAANLAGLGATPILVGSIGNDSEANELRESLSKIGVDPSYLVGSERGTIVKTRIVAHSQHVVRVDREDVRTEGSSDNTAIVAVIDGLLSQVDGIVISDYGKGFLTDEVLRFVIERGREIGKPVFVDPKGRDYGKYSGATLITPNRREAAEACRLHEELPDLIEQAGKILLAETGVESALITQGEHGMTLFRAGDGPIHIDAHAVETYDVTGAGDTVIATIAAAHSAGASLEESARLANRAAGLVVQQVGTTAITAADLTEAGTDE